MELNLSETLLDDRLLVCITKRFPMLGILNVSRYYKLINVGVEQASFPSLRFLVNPSESCKSTEIYKPLRNASKFRTGTRLSESDPINFRWFGIGTDLWSLIAVSDVDNTVTDSIEAKYIPMCHHVLI